MLRTPDMLTLQDTTRDGQVLMNVDTWQMGITALPPAASQEQDLSWADFSATRDLSPDCKLLLFDETGEAGGGPGIVYVRRLDGSSTVSLGFGVASSLSSDGKWFLGYVSQGTQAIALLPTGPGESQVLPNRKGFLYQNLNWLPSGKQFIFIASLSGRAARAYEIGWGKEGALVYVYRPYELPAKVYAIDVGTGRRQLWKQLVPPDTAGITLIRPPASLTTVPAMRVTTTTSSSTHTWSMASSSAGVVGSWICPEWVRVEEASPCCYSSLS